MCEGEAERDGVGDFDGRREDEVERKGAGEVATTRDGSGWTGAEGCVTVGDGLADADAGVVTVAAGLLE